MKFIELKSSLNIIDNAYYLFGKDAFLLSSAQKLIENACAPLMPDFNIARFNEEDFDVCKILEACSSYPLGDNFRCVVVKGGDFNKSVLEKFTNYLKAPNKSTCLVIVEPIGGKEFGGKLLSKYATQVDCNYLEETLLKKIVAKNLGDLGVRIDVQGLDALVKYCNYDLTRLNLEISKLANFVGKGNMVDVAAVDKLVSKDVEYSIFELTNALSEKNNKKCFDVLNFLVESGQSAQMLLALILNSFRRMFYAVITKATNADIASMLDVKEYAIKIAKAQGMKFTPVKLKKILELGANMDLEIRRGGIDSLNAVYTFVSNILLM